MENQLLELIKTRRSCRHYKAEQVSDKELNAVLEAGEYAPTGHGLQDPIIVAVQNNDIKAQLARLNAQIMGVDSNPYYDVLPICLFSQLRTTPMLSKTALAYWRT